MCTFPLNPLYTIRLRDLRLDTVVIYVRLRDRPSDGIVFKPINNPASKKHAEVAQVLRVERLRFEVACRLSSEDETETGRGADGGANVVVDTGPEIPVGDVAVDCECSCLEKVDEAVPHLHLRTNSATVDGFESIW